MASRDDTALAALIALGDDHTLGRYELLAPIGRGGMGIVWAARLRSTRGFSKLVALKTMLPSLSRDPQFERMFLAEAALAAKIHHPNVCAIQDLGEERGILYLVMEWIDGDSLAVLSASAGVFPYGVAARLAASGARGLSAGERAGVMHRDVSPQNVLVTPDGHVSVVDFGIAKSVADQDRNTRSGYVRGKLPYLAPEQIYGDPLDARADVFSLGVVLYELTTGTHPFHAATDLATILRIGSADEAPTPAQADYPADLWAIVKKALAKDPGARFGSMRELAAELDAFAVRASATEEAVAAFVGPPLASLQTARADRLESAMRDADARAARIATKGKSEPPKRGRTWGPLVLIAAAACAIAGTAWAAISARTAPIAPSAVREPETVSAAPASASVAPPSAATASAPLPAASQRPRPSRPATPPVTQLGDTDAAPPTSASTAVRFRSPDF